MADSNSTPRAFPSPTNANLGAAKSKELAYQVKQIRHALIIGLSSYAEIQRIEDSYLVLKEFGKTPIDDRLKPVGQVAFANVAFAAALAALEAMADEVAP